MKLYEEHDSSLFAFFYDQVISRPSDTYISSNGAILNYGEAYIRVLHIMQSIRKATDLKNNCVALNFKDQQKLLLSFWACTALGTEIVLLPELALDRESLKSEAYKLETDIMLTDFVAGPGCLDIDLDQATGPATQWEEMADNRRRNIYFFTSGTTGHSKFITTSYYQFIRAINCIRENNIMPYTSSQHVLITVPLFHSYGLSAMVEYTQGGSCLLLPKVKDYLGPLQSLLDVKTGEQVTAIEGVPYFYKQMAVVLNRLKLPNLRHIGMGGDSVSPDLIKKIADKKEHISFSIRYGVTEIPSIVSVNYFMASQPVIEKSLGNILPIYEARLYDENGDSQASAGELVIECLLYPGRLVRIHTNDIVEGSGNELTFKSRKTFIKYKGYKINPVEVEGFLTKHQDITDARVHLLNEVLTAEIVSSAEAPPAISEIREFLSGYVSAYMIPDQFTIVDAIQRTRTGKIVRM